jgi:hypothetical protein
LKQEEFNRMNRIFRMHRMKDILFPRKDGFYHVNPVHLVNPVEFFF